MERPFLAWIARVDPTVAPSPGVQQHYGYGRDAAQDVKCGVPSALGQCGDGCHYSPSMRIRRYPNGVALDGIKGPVAVA
jgi:hypothetical protein